MPNTQRLVEHGVIGNISTLQPPLSPMLWTSIATGKRPYKHGILGFTEPTPDGSGIRPISNAARRTRAIWNILQLAGLKSNVIGWWPSHPAEPIDGVMVSDMFQKIAGPIDKPWPLRPGTVHPPELADSLKQFRLHPQELSDQHIGPFVPGFASIEQDKDHRLESIAKIIAECTSVHAAATAVMQHVPWDFMAVYYDAIDHFSHGFMRFYPPQLPWIPEHDFTLFNQVLEGGYRYHDMMLGTLLQLAGDDTTVILVSDHGFHSDHLRPHSVPLEPAGPALQHRNHGIILLHGPGIKHDEHIYGASLLDITPTILHLFGQPVGDDMDGTVLINAIDGQAGTISSISSWDDVPGDDGRHPAEMQLDPRESYESIQRLVELGYIEAPGPNRAETVQKTIRELRYNEARAYMDASQFATARDILSALVESNPDEYRFGIKLITCYLASGNEDSAENLVDTLYERKQHTAAQAEKKLSTFEADHNDIDMHEWSEKDIKTFRQLKNAATFNPFALHILKGTILTSRGKWQEALDEYESALEQGAGYTVFVRAASALCKLQKYSRAQSYLEQALALNPDDPEIYIGFCRVCHAEKQHEAALDHALQAVGLDFQNPLAHYFLALSLYRLGRMPRAAEALHVALKLNPNFSLAHDLLAALHEKHFKNPESAAFHREKAEAARAAMKALNHGEYADDDMLPDSLPFTSDMDLLHNDSFPSSPLVTIDDSVVIVSGLPRSGTSLMMQMLAAGGSAVLTDNQRLADQDNPKGYFEYTPVKNTRNDSSWVDAARGKAVKVIAQLLRYLPRSEHHHYRVIFMVRPLTEILDSQKVMLNHKRSVDKPVVNAKLFDTFSKQLTRIKRFLKAAGIPTLFVTYHDCIDDPTGTAQKINVFLDGTCDVTAMADIIDPALYRQRERSV